MVCIGLLYVKRLHSMGQRVKIFCHHMRLCQAGLSGKPQHEQEAEETFHRRDFNGLMGSGLLPGSNKAIGTSRIVTGILPDTVGSDFKLTNM